MAEQPAKVRAPEFPAYAQWINSDRRWSMQDFRGKVVLLDFWTYCCINCMHILPDLKRLEKKYPELVVVGVHSAKYNGEKDLENIREAVLRYNIEHLVINDYRFELWNQYGIHAWPSFVLIDPEGYVAGTASGEGLYDLFDQNIARMIETFGARGLVDHERIEFALARFTAPRSLLSFPGKLEVDAGGRRLFISDSNNDRILVIDPDGRILEVIGSGVEGNRDGSFDQARFFHPQGMAWDAQAGVLYIADTENHTLRRADFTSRMVTTVLGTGEQARGYANEGTGTGLALNSPWDLALYEGRVIIAMAGPHQLWSFDPHSGRAEVFAGSGRENILDGPAASAQLAQPSGVSTGPGVVYFADSEVSAVRKVEEGRVVTLVGEGLFDFGDEDGRLSGARLQHALGVLYQDGKIYVADTYNNKIKVINPERGEIRTLIGTGKSGSADGPAAGAQLNEPNDIQYLAGRFYITDTNNGLVRVYDPQSGGVSTLEITRLEELEPDRGSPWIKTIRLPEREVGVGRVTLEVSVTLAEGMMLNQEAPNYLQVVSADDRPVKVLPYQTEPGSGSFGASVPLELPAGTASLRIEFGFYYCDHDKKSSCYIEQKVFELPLHASASGPSRIEFSHRI